MTDNKSFKSPKKKTKMIGNIVRRERLKSDDLLQINGNRSIINKLL